MTALRGGAARRRRPARGAAAALHGRHPGAGGAVPRRAEDRRGAGAGQHDADRQGPRRASRSTAARGCSRAPPSSPRPAPAVGGLAVPRRRRRAADGQPLPTSREGLRVRELGRRSSPPAPARATRGPPRPTRRSRTPPASGSTPRAPPGTPKGAMHRHGSLRRHGRDLRRDVLAIGPDDVCFSVAKFFFAYGLGNSVTFPFSVGASTVLVRARPSPAGTLACSSRRTGRRCSSPGPTYYAALLAADLPADAFAGVRACVSRRRGVPGRPVRAVHATASASRCSTASARPRCCTSSSAAGPAARPAGHHRRDRRRLRAAKIEDDDGAAGPRRHARATSTSAAARRPPATGAASETTRRVFQRAVAAHRRHLRPRRRRLLHLARPHRRHHQGRRHLGLARPRSRTRLREHPAVAQVAVVSVPDADGLDKPVACVVPAPGDDRRPRTAGRVLPGGPGRVQAPPARAAVRRAAADRHRQAPALPGPRVRRRSPHGRTPRPGGATHAGGGVAPRG